MDAKKVMVTYCDDFGVWSTVYPHLQSRVPFRNLQWRTQWRTQWRGQTDKTIPVVNVDFKKYSPSILAVSSGNPFSLTQNPFLNLYLVQCNDSEVYKQVVRKQIALWVEQIKSKRHQEALIVLVSTNDLAGKKNVTPNFLSMKSSMYDKIKADFPNVKCTHLRLLDDPKVSDNEIWLDVITKMKEGIMSSFSQHVQQLEEDIRRIDMQRELPGWNYCTFFILKEQLAQACETMSLNEDALVQYDELDASFFQTFKDPNSTAPAASSWTENFGGTGPGDDNADLLNVSKKPYRDLIMQNNITVFDFRTYLFGRQCQLLMRLNRPVEICQRAQAFIAGFSRNIRKHRTELCENFVESWIYSSCTNVVRECQELLLGGKDNHGTFKAFDAAKAELLHYARRQLDKLGIQRGLLPNDLPFSMYLDTDSAISVLSHGGDKKPGKQSAAEEGRENGKLRQERQEENLTGESEPDKRTEENRGEGHEGTKTARFTSPELRVALSSPDEFDTLYMSLSTRAMKAYETSDRGRFVLFLNGDVAALMFHRAHFTECIRILQMLDTRYSADGWVVIDNALLRNSALCYRHVGDGKMYSLKCLALLVNSLEAKAEGDIGNGDNADWVAKLDEAIEMLQDDVSFPLLPLFPVTVLSKDDRQLDKAVVHVSVINQLPKPVRFDELRLRLAGASENADAEFMRSGGVLEPGNNHFKLTCEKIEHGNFVMESFAMRVGKLRFAHSFLDPADKRVFRINESPGGIKVEVSRPRRVDLQEDPHLQVDIKMNEVNIVEGWVKLASVDEGIGFSPSFDVFLSLYSAIDGEGVQAETVHVAEEAAQKIPLPKNCKAGQVIRMLVPYAMLDGHPEQKIKIHVSYIDETGIPRGYRTIKKVSLFVPLELSYRSYIREDCMFLKIDVKPTGVSPLCMLGTKAEAPNSMTISGHLDAATSPEILFPGQRASYIYRIVADDVNAMDGNTLRFSIDFYTLSDEVTTALMAQMREALTASGLGHHYEFIKEAAAERLRSALDFSTYGLTGELRLGKLDTGFAEALFANDDVQTQKDVMSMISKFFEENRTWTRKSLRGNPEVLLQTVVFRIVPHTCKVLMVVELGIRRNGRGDLVVGNACGCDVNIRWSENWGKAESTSIGKFYCEIFVDYENWLVCGKRKLEFVMERGATTTFSVTLVPLRTGLLPLPLVSVHAADPAFLTPVSAQPVFTLGVETLYVNNAEQVLVLPRTRSKTVMIDPKVWNPPLANNHRNLA